MAKKMYNKVCEWCLCDFETTRGNKMYCSKRCQRLMHQDIERVRKGRPSIHGSMFTCPYCNETSQTSRCNQQTCGDPDCMNAHDVTQKEKAYQETAKERLLREYEDALKSFEADDDHWLTYRVTWCSEHVTQTQLYPLG